MKFHPAVKTIDGMEGHEYDWVIIDLVVTRGSWVDLGFLKDDARCNVAFTRAKCAFVALLPKAVGAPPSSTISGTPSYLVDFARYMTGKGAVYAVIPTVELTQTNTYLPLKIGSG